MDGTTAATKVVEATTDGQRAPQDSGEDSPSANSDHPFVLICGGCNDCRSFDDVHRVLINMKIDSEEDCVTVAEAGLANLAAPRYGHAVCVTANNEVFAIGGCDGRSCLRSAEKYDPKEDRWVMIPNMRFPKRNLAACAVRGDRVVALGGESEKSALVSVEVYDSNNKNWQAFPPMAEARQSCAAAAIGCQVYVVGGRDEPGNHGKVLKSGEVIALNRSGPGVASSWKPIRSMNQARCGLALVPFKGKLYAVGGSNGVKPLNSVEVYTPATNTWTPGPYMHKARAWPALFVWEDHIVAFGGRESTAQRVVDSVEVWNPEDEDGGSWRLLGCTGLLDRWMFSAVTVYSRWQNCEGTESDGEAPSETSASLARLESVNSTTSSRSFPADGEAQLANSLRVMRNSTPDDGAGIQRNLSNASGKAAETLEVRNLLPADILEANSMVKEVDYSSQVQLVKARLDEGELDDDASHMKRGNQKKSSTKVDSLRANYEDRRDKWIVDKDPMAWFES